MSRAVARDQRVALDAYFTPEELARKLVAVLPIGDRDRILEPHAGAGAFVRSLATGRRHVFACDINPESRGLIEADFAVVQDFLALGEPGPGVTWIVGNPPYSGAEEHCRHAIAITGRHVAFLLRLAILESAKRIPFWKEHPPRKVWAISERPSFTGGGTDSAAYGWFWWDNKYSGPTELGWLSWRS